MDQPPSTTLDIVHDNSVLMRFRFSGGAWVSLFEEPLGVFMCVGGLVLLGGFGWGTGRFRVPGGAWALSGVRF